MPYSWAVPAAVGTNPTRVRPTSVIDIWPCARFKSASCPVLRDDAGSSRASVGWRRCFAIRQPTESPPSRQSHHPGRASTRSIAHCRAAPSPCSKPGRDGRLACAAWSPHVRPFLLASCHARRCRSDARGCRSWPWGRRRPVLRGARPGHAAARRAEAPGDQRADPGPGPGHSRPAVGPRPDRLGAHRHRQDGCIPAAVPATHPRWRGRRHAGPAGCPVRPPALRRAGAGADADP